MENNVAGRSICIVSFHGGLVHRVSDFISWPTRTVVTSCGMNIAIESGQTTVFVGYVDCPNCIDIAEERR